MHVLRCLGATNRSLCALVAAIALSICACGGADDDTSNEGSGGETGSGGDSSGGDSSAGGAETGGDSSTGGSDGLDYTEATECEQQCGSCFSMAGACIADAACRECLHFGTNCDGLGVQPAYALSQVCPCIQQSCSSICTSETICQN